MAELAKMVEAIEKNMSGFTKAVCGQRGPLRIELLEAKYPTLQQLNPKGSLMLGMCMNHPDEDLAGEALVISKLSQTVDLIVKGYKGEADNDKWSYVPGNRSRTGLDMYVQEYSFGNR